MHTQLGMVVAGQPGHPAVQIQCSACGTKEEIFVKSLALASVEEFINKKFQQRGWDVGKGRHRERDTCPNCKAGWVQHTPSHSRTVPLQEGLEQLLDQMVSTEVQDTQPTIEQEQPQMDTMIANTKDEVTFKGKAKGPNGRKKGDRNVSFNQQMQAFELLKANLVQDGTFYKYTNDFNDKKVAEATQTTPAWVGGFRTRQFGKLRTIPYFSRPDAKRGPGFTSHTAKLEARVKYLEDQFLVLEERISKVTQG